METVTSADGTTIAFERIGQGPPLVLLGGALSDRSAAAAVAAELARTCTVVASDRRGRGDSGDTPPYDVAREVEDVAAVLAAVGDRPHLYGHSSGGVLALRTAEAHAHRIASLAVYEPPIFVDRSRTLPPEDYADRVAELVAAGRRGDAVATFLTEAVGVPAEAVETMRNAPSWPAMEALAHTIPYDGRVMDGLTGGTAAPLARWSALPLPALVLAGGGSQPWQLHAARALADALPDARFRILEGQDHAPEPALLAAVLSPWILDVEGR